MSQTCWIGDPRVAEAASARRVNSHGVRLPMFEYAQHVVTCGAYYDGFQDRYTYVANKPLSCAIGAGAPESTNDWPQVGHAVAPTTLASIGHVGST